MAINQRLDLKQGQALAMTPQLQQAIKLLQMSNLELAEFIEGELEKNPLLEREDAQPQDPPERKEGTPAPGGAQEESRFLDAGAGREGRQDDSGRELDADFGNVYTNDDSQAYDAFSTNSFSGAGKGGSAKFDDPDYSLENTMAEQRSLRDHLTEQVHLEFPDPKDRGIALLLVGHLDESGYFRADTGPLAERLGTTPARIETVLERLRRLDPPGIFARDLRECLALQLRDKDRLDPAMEALLDNLGALAAHDMKKLERICGVDAEDLRDMIAEIRALNPKPATAFDHFVSQTVVPDVLMRPLPKSRGGGWAVELNGDTLPRVLVNRTYYTEVSQGARSKEDKAYLAEQMNTANWLVKAMDQRAQTILKVAGEIIRLQDAFFNYGIEFLKPLVLKDVAQAISMHESTVSRVTSNKYIGTPRGVFEMKYFFTSAVPGAGGDAVSSEAVKARIRALVDAEDPARVLSDDDIARALRKEGIDAARRTVAKYREALGIPSSVQRRRRKKGG